MTRCLADTYRRAADVIRKCGWHQSLDRSPHGALRVDEAIRLVVTGHAVWSSPGLDEERYLADVVGLTLGWGPLVARIATWNNAPERTVDEVLDVLERAAVAAESGGAA